MKEDDFADFLEHKMVNKQSFSLRDAVINC